MESGHSGEASAVRGLELLWGLGERPNRGRRPALTLDQIVRTAIGIADVTGLAAVSMRRVAERLGCTTMSLYRYVPGKAELLDLMTDAVMGEVPPADAAPGDWRTRLELSARADWGLYQRHPWILRLPAGRPALGPHGFAWYESVLRVLTATGLPPAALVHVFDLVDAYVRGAARDALDAAAVERHSGLTDEQWWAARAHFWDAVFVPARYPVVASLAPRVPCVTPATVASSSASGSCWTASRRSSGTSPMAVTKHQGVTKSPVRSAATPSPAPLPLAAHVPTAPTPVANVPTAPAGPALRRKPGAESPARGSKAGPVISITESSAFPSPSPRLRSSP
ncbi:TetR/AcrR family transcriptional regulator C-terminal domain-containing protein [Streptomyces indonesiensis]